MGKLNQLKPIPSLEDHLNEILNLADSQEWTIQDLFLALKGKGYPFLIILLSLPFCQPIQIPGFSTPFGIVLTFIGLRMAFGKRFWWPQWILRQKISPKLLKGVVKNSLIFFRFLKPLIHPRWNWLFTDPFLHRIHGVFVIVMGFFLALPLPIPFSNLFAAWGLLFMGLGLIEDDGLFVCLAYGIGLIGVLILGFLILMIHNWAKT